MPASFRVEIIARDLCADVWDGDSEERGLRQAGGPDQHRGDDREDDRDGSGVCGGANSRGGIRLNSMNEPATIVQPQTAKGSSRFGYQLYRYILGVWKFFFGVVLTQTVVGSI